MAYSGGGTNPPNYGGNQSQQDFANQQLYYNYNNNNNQSFVTNQFGQYEDQFSQQNYSCYTPTVNSVNSYITAGDPQAAHSQTTQSSSYSQTAGTASTFNGQVAHPTSMDSTQRHSQAIPTYSAAVNATSNKSETLSTQSQQQIISPVEKQAPAAAVKSENIDLLSGIDFTMKNATIDNIPTLTPVSVAKPVEESPKKVLVPTPPVVAPAPVKLNDDLAGLDFTSIPAAASPEPLKAVEAKKLSDPFDDAAVLKQFHKEVESLEKFMETLTIKTLNGVTPLANKWKELQDLLIKDEAKRSVSVARLFPDKNRSDKTCLPYDHARVLLPTSTDNYINAVLVKDCGPAGFILTQTPMTNTVNDYWEMIWSQKANTLVCLHAATEVRW